MVALRVAAATACHPLQCPSQLTDNTFNSCHPWHCTVHSFSAFAFVFLCLCVHVWIAAHSRLCHTDVNDLLLRTLEKTLRHEGAREKDWVLSEVAMVAMPT
jgi:hypothetical protein